jgi:hypothetical protein
MTSADLPFRQCADAHRTDRFICVQPKSGHAMILPEDEEYTVYLPPDATDEALGQALLDCLDKSRFIRTHPTRALGGAVGRCMEAAGLVAMRRRRSCRLLRGCG